MSEKTEKLVHILRHGDHFKHDESSWILNDSVIIAHAILMLCAWGIFLNTGVILARYFKFERGIFPYWFRYHAFLQIVGIILGISGIVLIFSHVHAGGGWSAHLGQGSGFHQWLGFLLFLSLLIQPLLGWLAHKNYLRTKQPSQYHVPHRWLGRIMFSLSIITLGLGIRLISHELFNGNDLIIWCCFAFLITFIIGFISYYELLKNKQSNKNDNNEINNNNNNNNNNINSFVMQELSNEEENDSSEGHIVFPHHESNIQTTCIVYRGSFMFVMYSLVTITVIIFLSCYIIMKPTATTNDT